MPTTYPGPWQTPPPRQQITDTYSFPSAVRRGSATQYAAADPVTFGGAWADLLNPAVTYGGSAFSEIFIEHLYDATGYLGQPIDTWEINQWLVDALPRLRYPFPAIWTPPLPWPTHAIDWEYDFSGNTTGVSVLLSEDLKVTATLHLEDARTDYTPDTAYATDIIITPVDPTSLTLDAGFTGQEPRIQNVRQSELVAWPVIGRGSVPAGGSASITTDPIDVATYLACLDVVNGSVGTLRFTINYDNMRSGTEPPANNLRRIQFDSMDVVSDWQPPRWRFLYDAPVRLRQHPRDDVLGGTPRQNRATRSTRASARQGWAGTYR